VSSAPSEVDEIHAEILARMSPAQKLRAANQLIHSAKRLKAAWMRAQHPKWAEERIQKEVRDAFLLRRD
jgi:hypothetical protein